MLYSFSKSQSAYYAQNKCIILPVSVVTVLVLFPAKSLTIFLYRVYTSSFSFFFLVIFYCTVKRYTDRVKRIWYLSPMRAAKVQASLRIRAVSPEPSLLAHTSSESRGTFRQKARSLAPLNGWACAVKICNDGMLEDTNSLDGAHTGKWSRIGHFTAQLMTVHFFALKIASQLWCFSIINHGIW